VSVENDNPSRPKGETDGLDLLGPPTGYQRRADVLYAQLADTDAYFDDPLAPTPLDPNFAISDYIETAFDRMADKTEITADEMNVHDTHLYLMLQEMADEHTMRCDKNQQRMERLKSLLSGQELIPDDLAEMIKRARLGQANVVEIAKLIALAPLELEGIEIMKSTCPLDRDAMRDVTLKSDRVCMSDLHGDGVDFKWRNTRISKPGLEDIKQVFLSNNGTTKNVLLFKTKDATLTINGVDMEIITRRTFIRLPVGTHMFPAGVCEKDGSTVQPIAISRYIRLAREEEYGSFQAIEDLPQSAEDLADLQS